VTRYIREVRDKRKLTEELIKQLDPDSGITVKRAMHTWWFNIRKTGGMRLTGPGYTVFTQDLDLTCYEFAISDPQQFNQHLILDLDRKMQMPYYISATKGIPKKIVFFGSREAVMVNLYGNLQQFLDNYKP
tara:strand:+ start:89 stop:481 length:393 start_codon:yes stop_codon:yes gene_type:complete